MTLWNEFLAWRDAKRIEREKDLQDAVLGYITRYSSAEEKPDQYLATCIIDLVRYHDKRGIR